jgi:hypothetical protein
MSPTWARKGSKRWRYYVSQAAPQGDKSKAASILRVPAADVEKLVAEAVGKLSLSDASLTDIRDLIESWSATQRSESTCQSLRMEATARGS